MPPLVQYLLVEYKLQGTFLILAALQLHIVAAALLYRTSIEHAKVQARQHRRKLKNEHKNYFENISFNSNKNESNNNGIVLEAIQRNSLTSRYIMPNDRKWLSNDALCKEVSMYRCIPLTGSVTNMEEFKKISINSLDKQTFPSVTKKMSFDLENRRNSASNILSNTRTLQPSSDIRHRSTSESMDESTLLNMTKQTRINEEASLRKLVSLRRFAMSTNVRSNGYLNNERGSIDKLNVSVASNDIHGTLDNNHFTNVDIYSNQEKVDVIRISNQDDENSDLKKTIKGNTSSGNNYNHISTTIKKIFDTEILKNPSMICMTVSVCLMSVGTPHFLFYLHAHFGQFGIDSSEITKLLMISALVDMAGRLLFGFVADLKIVPLSVLYFLWLVKPMRQY